MIRCFVFSFLAALFAAIVPASARTGLYCNPPMVPLCMNQHGTFDSKFSFDSCRMEVTNYVRQAKDYADCLERERQDALQTAQKVIDTFNCKAGGGSFCP